MKKDRWQYDILFPGKWEDNTSFIDSAFACIQLTRRIIQITYSIYRPDILAVSETDPAVQMTCLTVTTVAV